MKLQIGFFQLQANILLGLIDTGVVTLSCHTVPGQQFHCSNCIAKRLAHREICSSKVIRPTIVAHLALAEELF